MQAYPILDAGVADVGDRHAGHVDDGVLGWREKLALVGHLGVGKINIGTIDMFKEMFKPWSVIAKQLVNYYIQ